VTRSYGSGRFHDVDFGVGEAVEGLDEGVELGVGGGDWALEGGLFLRGLGGGEVLGQKRLSTGAGLWHLSGMARGKENAAEVALGHWLGGLKGGRARAEKLSADGLLHVVSRVA
jgi:hypothetical protein